MNARKLMLSGLAFAAILFAGFAMPSTASADTGTIKNLTGIKIVYHTGYADERGYVSWSSHTLAPGESHTWTVRDPKRRPLQMRYDWTLGDGKFVEMRGTIATRPNGFRSAFTRTGQRIYVNASGKAW